ncbi:MAG: hypothetical protein ACREOH_01645, partial [Candidatus Entotheonellia bacterium]
MYPKMNNPARAFPWPAERCVAGTKGQRLRWNLYPMATRKRRVPSPGGWAADRDTAREVGVY